VDDLQFRVQSPPTSNVLQATLVRSGLDLFIHSYFADSSANHAADKARFAWTDFLLPGKGWPGRPYLYFVEIPLHA
jgi:hypothetical protein